MGHPWPPWGTPDPSWVTPDYCRATSHGPWATSQIFLGYRQCPIQYLCHPIGHPSPLWPPPPTPMDHPLTPMGPPLTPHGVPPTIHDSLPAASGAIPGVFWAFINPPLTLIQHLLESPDPSWGCPDPSWVPPYGHSTPLFKIHPWVALIILDLS